MKRCRSCFFWNLGDKQDQKECMRPECPGSLVHADGRWVSGDAILQVVTAADFGCVQWKSRTEGCR